jgi:hypothetical protein
MKHTIQNQKIELAEKDDKIEELKNQIEEMRMEMAENHHELYNMAKDEKQTINEMNDKIEDIKKSSQKILSIVESQSQSNVKERDSDYCLAIYKSSLKPVVNKYKLKNDQTLIHTFNGGYDNYLKLQKKFEEDFEEIACIESTNLDTFKALIENTELNVFIIDTKNRSIVINTDALNDFIDKLKETITSPIHKDESKQLKEDLNKPVKDDITILKENLLNKYPNLCFKVNRYIKLVHVYKDDEYIPINELNVEEAASLDWYWYKKTADEYVKITNTEIKTTKYFSG